MGLLKMIAPDTSIWLSKYYPGLIISKDQDEVNGKLVVTASYNFETDTFQNLSNGQENEIDGEVFSGEFSLTISNKKERAWSALPALFVHDETLPMVMSRHFNEWQDKSACLCGPMQEKTFLSEGFEFDRYFEKLAIPFLYGQLYYNKHSKWPWPELEHGGLGVLESYFFDNDPTKVIDCLNALKLDQLSWKTIGKSLQFQNPVKGHLPCFCGSGKPIRSCHPDAWKGVIKLKNDIINQKISI